MAWLVSKRIGKWAASLFAALCLSIGAYAASGPAEKAGPTIIIDKSRAGDKCVEDTAFMRKNHPKLLLHQRDETVHKGIRTEKHSLKNCVSCHASSKDNRVIGSDEHFCQSCHTYAAVKMDCWQCHTTKSKPVASATPAPSASVRGEKK